jgi:hypothetical protein
MSNDFLANIRQRTVAVHEGSGVLMPALAKDYCYVLTAAHNLRVERDDPSALRPASEICVHLSDGTKCVPLDVVYSATEDAAILILPSIDIEPISHSDSFASVQDSIWMIGYPGTRRNNTDLKTRLMRGAIEDTSVTLFIVSTTAFAPQDEVMGFSGAGVFRRVDDEWVLIGIEYSMEGTADEGHNWLKCVRIGVFEQLISLASYNDQPCVPFLPPFLLNFSYLMDFAFPLPGIECPITHDALRGLLAKTAHAKLGLACPTPHILMEKFSERLLIQGDPKYRLADKKLWVSWLEFLVLSALLDEVETIDDDYIEELRSRRLLLYSGSVKEWTGFLEKILFSNFDGLAPDGLVLISNNCAVPPVKTRSVRDLSKIVRDISAPSSKKRDIGLSRKPFPPKKLIHLDGLHKDSVTQNEALFLAKDGFDENVMLDLLKKVYRETIAL